MIAAGFVARVLLRASCAKYEPFALSLSKCFDKLSTNGRWVTMQIQSTALKSVMI